MSDVLIELHDAKGKVVALAVIDAADAIFANERWYLLKNGYVVRTIVKSGRKSMLYLHRELMGVKGRLDQVDHIDMDRLNNRRANLRVGTTKLNLQNRGANKSNKWGRGVCYRPKLGKWEVNVKLNGKSHYLGRYEDPIEAATVASKFRAKHMPWSVDARDAAAEHNA